jgi:hypothetical protein
MGVFSIYFENNYLRIVQEGFDKNQKPILYDIVRQKLPLFEWFKLNLKIAKNGAYEVNISNQEEKIIYQFSLKDGE